MFVSSTDVLAKDRLFISGEIERVIDANHFETLWQAILKRCSYHVQVCKINEYTRRVY